MEILFTWNDFVQICFSLSLVLLLRAPTKPFLRCYLWCVTVVVKFCTYGVNFCRKLRFSDCNRQSMILFLLETRRVPFFGFLMNLKFVKSWVLRQSILENPRSENSRNRGFVSLEIDCWGFSRVSSLDQCEDSKWGLIDCLLTLGIY